jgi:hypothetical protein
VADMTQVMFTHEELVEALLRHHGIRKGLWSLTVNLRTVANNFIADGMEVAGPGCAVIVESVGLQRVTASIPGLTVDAELLAKRPQLRTVD